MGREPFGAEKLSKAVAAGPVFASGQVADSPDASAYGRAMQAPDKVEGDLRQAGSTTAELLFATLSIKDRCDLDRINRAWGDWLEPDCAPSRACVQAAPSSAGFVVQVCAVA
jgi:enamine deaminase RidA (YjgF/YER057c/UK114 family)